MIVVRPTVQLTTESNCLNVKMLMKRQEQIQNSELSKCDVKSYTERHRYARSKLLENIANYIELPQKMDHLILKWKKQFFFMWNMQYI